MKKLLLLVLPFLFSTALAGECIRYNDMDRFDAISSTSLKIYTWNDTYDVTVTSCFSLPHATNIGFDSWSSVQVCENDHVVVLDPWGYASDRCWITNITKE